MMYGFTYRGKHTSELGIIAKVNDRPILPPIRLDEASAKYRDGSFDYSNAGGRIFYDDRLVTVDITVIGQNKRDMENKASKVVTWLNGWYDDLIFDDMPGFKWNCRPVEMSALSAELYRVGKGTVQFRCRPFNSFIIDIGDDIILDTAHFPVDMDIPLDDMTNVYDLEPSTTAREKTLTFGYIGTAPMKPVIEISNAPLSSGTIIDMNGAILTINHAVTASQTLKIDCENWAVTIGGISVEVSGDFPDLKKGENEISIQYKFSSTRTENGKLEIKGTPLFLYGG